MANETLAAQVTDLINSASISQTMLAHAMEFIIAHDKFRYYSLVGVRSPVQQVARLTSNYTVDDNGATVDGEFDATEGTPLSITQLNTENVQFTCSEYGVRHAISDIIYEDSILGSGFVSVAMMNAAHLLALAVEQASLSLLSSLSASYGTTNTDLTLAVAMSGLDGIRTRGTLADSSIYTLDNKAWADLKTAAAAIGSSQLSYGASGEQIVGVSRDGSNGLGANRMVGRLYGAPVFETGLTPTANSAVDVVSGVWTPSSPVNDEHATFAYVEKRPFRMEIERDGGLRADVLTFTRRCAVGEATDFSGSKFISNAA